MKENIAQLKKEIEEYRGYWRKELDSRGIKEFKIQIRLREAKLQTLQEVCEKIENWFIDEGLLDSMGQRKLQELLKKFRGEE